jgi:hypothetical protein
MAFNSSYASTIPMLSAPLRLSGNGKNKVFGGTQRGMKRGDLELKGGF